MIWNRPSPKFNFDTMFKRSFGTKEGRVAKSKLVKTTYPEHAKRKMQDSLDSPPVGRYGRHTGRPQSTANIIQQPNQPHNHNGCGS